MVKPNQVHASSLVHREFNPCCDSDIFIDLENLPPDTPMMGFEVTYNALGPPDIPIPLFIAGPLLVFRLHSEDFRSSCLTDFIRSMPADRRQQPTPENPDCEVCCLVQWLLTECQDYDQCFRRLYPKPQVIVYEVMKEIWLRLYRKPILISRKHLLVTKQISFLTLANGEPFIFPGDPERRLYNLDWPLKKAYSFLWTNALIYTLRQTLNRGGMQNDVAAFLLLNIIRILRRFLMALTPPPYPVQICDELFVLDCIHHSPISSHPVLMLLATDLSRLLIRLDNFWNVNEHGREVCAPDDLSMYDCFAFTASLNLLLMNMTCSFYKNNRTQVYVHYYDCRQHPERCLCRYARFLEQADQNH
ncbi:unnamed protein product [Taenia asiatica]|uniref:Mab-21 domain-containing protein n=1 Tax=Taenia asiatica TaxID=60517 RepID=A0A0R3VUG9_TAEAS|nr:unnamed protein product [Taenia asiatica]